MDDGAPKLPSDLEQPVSPAGGPVVSTPPPPIVPPTITPPPTPPTVVPEESPEPIKPKSNLKKNLPKIAGGLLVMALLIGGILAGGNLLQQRTQVEQQAECKDGTVTLKGTNTITCKNGKKVETKTDAKVLDTLRNLKEETGINRLDGDTYESEDSLSKAIQYSTTTANGGQVIITKEESEQIRQKLSNLINNGNLTELRYGGTTYTSVADMIDQIGKIQEGSSFYFCENSNEKSCGAINYDGFVSFMEGTGEKCGVIQFDAIDTTSGPGLLINISCGEAGERTTEEVSGGPGPSPTPGVSPSPGPTPTPSPSLSCVDLTSDKPTPTLGDTITLTCEANFSSVIDPIAQFYVTVNDVGVRTSNNIPIDSITKKASYSFVSDSFGNWKAQCRVCITNGACTQWGQAN